MPRRACLVAISCIVGILVQPRASAGPFDKDEYAARRTRLMESVGDGAAVFLGAPAPAGDYRFRQGHDFFYFTGVEIPDAYLIVDGARKESVLFYTTDEETAHGDGIPLELIRNPVAYTTVERVQPAEEFSAALAGLVGRGKPVYAMFKPEELSRENSNEKLNALQRTMTLTPWDGRLTRELQFVRQFRDRYPQADLRDGSPLVWNRRKHKTRAELDVLRQAARLGVQGHHALIQSTHRLEQGFEVALAEALRDVSLYYFDEHGRPVLERTGEHLQKVALIIAVHKDAEIMDGFHVLFDCADPVGEQFVIGIRHAQEFHAAFAEFIDRLENVSRDHGNVLEARCEIVIEIFFNLTLALALGGFVDRELDAPVAILHHLRHEGGIFGGDVLVIEVQQLAEAHHVVVEIHPVIHFPELDISDDMVNGRQAGRLGRQVEGLVGGGERSVI